jgi:uncharacterized protein YbjT (DUF2867 family)
MKVMITGVTGMVGEGVLHECLNHPGVEQIIVITRKPCGVVDPKLTEIVHTDFFDLSSIQEHLTGLDACFYCLGVSSVGMTESQYTEVTYDLTMYIAGLLALQNPEMVFCYVTAAGTDTSKSMWSRVKLRTEHDLAKLPFRQVYMFRPGYIQPTKGLNNRHRYYAAFTWMYPLIRRVIPKYVVTLSQLGKAMINVVNNGYPTSVIQCKDMAKLAD